MKKKEKYYSLNNILSKDCYYSVIFGERSNGKTYAVLKHGLETSWNNNKQFAIIRRFTEDFRGKRGATMFNGLVSNGEIEKITNGEWTDIYYYGLRWYFCRYGEGGKRETAEQPIAYGFSVASMEHDKSTSYPDITTIFFDEFLTRTIYLNDEFVLFMNVLSTIIRDRNDVKIFMCGNAVNQYSPYFQEMGLTNVKKMKPGDIDVYTYGDSGLKVAVEFSDSPNKGKPSDIYFAFNNPKLSMIKGSSGVWEIDIYPHCPIKYKPKDIQFIYFIIFDNECLQCEIINSNGEIFTFIHKKTTPIQNPDKDLIFTPDFNFRWNYRRKITKPQTELERKLYKFFLTDKVFYQDNVTGEIVRNYLNWSRTED